MHEIMVVNIELCTCCQIKDKPQTTLTEREKKKNYFSSYKCAGLLHEHVIVKTNFHSCIFLVQKSERYVENT